MLKDQTWIAGASPEKLIVRHRSGRLMSFFSFFFGSVFLAVAITEPGDIRWAAGVMSALNYVLAVVRSCLVTITFDRVAGEVECREQRLYGEKRATLPLAEFTGAEIRYSSRGGGKTRLGLATSGGVFIPIEQNFLSGSRVEIARAIDAWLGAGAPAAEPDAL